MSLAGFEVCFFLGCLVVALVFLAAALMSNRHGWWLVLVAAVVTALALGCALHVVAVRIDRTV